MVQPRPNPDLDCRGCARPHNLPEEWTRVILHIADGQNVTGLYLELFDDDDDEFGHGWTYRILGDDAQVWEGPAITVVRGAW